MEEELKEEKEKNYCRSCKRYYKKSISGTCPTCGGKLSTYRPNRHYFKDDTKEQASYMGKLIQIDNKLNSYDAQFRKFGRLIDNLELRYQQVINLLKTILHFSGRMKKKGGRLTMAKIIDYIEKVVDEPEEKEVDLVEEIVNVKQVEEGLKDEERRKVS